MSCTRMQASARYARAHARRYVRQLTDEGYTAGHAERQLTYLLPPRVNPPHKQQAKWRLPCCCVGRHTHACAVRHHKALPVALRQRPHPHMHAANKLLAGGGRQRPPRRRPRPRAAIIRGRPSRSLRRCMRAPPPPCRRLRHARQARTAGGRAGMHVAWGWSACTQRAQPGSLGGGGVECSGLGQTYSRSSAVQSPLKGGQRLAIDVEPAHWAT